MSSTYILSKAHVLLACCCLPFFFAPIQGKGQVIVFSENFDGTVQPYTTSASYTNADCSNFVVPDDTSSSVCGAFFCCSPVIISASGTGAFLFEGTNQDPDGGPDYSGPIYQTAINGTMVAGDVFVISFLVWLKDTDNPPQLIPQINGVNVGSYITPSSTTGWQPLTYTFIPVTNITNPIFSIYNATVSGFGNDFGVDNILIAATTPSAFILALNFTAFSAKVDGGNTILTWQTSSTITIDHFIVQQSTDGRHFTNIGNVASPDASPTNTYTYTTASSSDGLYYYRIAAVGKDGVTTYSSISTVTTDNQKQYVRVAPNPVLDGHLILRVNSTIATTTGIHIISTDGKVLIDQNKALQAGFNSIDIDLRNFLPGIYIVELNNNSHVDYVKFICL